MRSSGRNQDSDRKIIETLEMKNSMTQTKAFSENIASELDQKYKKIRDGEQA